MRRMLLVLLLAWSAGLWAQSSSPSNSAPAGSSSSGSNPPSSSSAPSKAHVPDSATSGAKSTPAHTPSLAPPRSDSVNADALGDDVGESSSKDLPVDLSLPDEELKAHPNQLNKTPDAEGETGNGDVGEFHPWDPHKAAKDIEVGDFYFKRGNYRAAESRYREALVYKKNDAIATFRLAECLEKMDRADEAREQYELYLKILPDGPQARAARKALARLKTPAAASAKPAP